MRLRAAVVVAALALLLPTTAALAQSLSGQITDQTGSAVRDAKVVLERDGPPPIETVTDDDGRFSFADLPAGAFHIAISAVGFAPQTLDGMLTAGQPLVLEPVRLTIAVGGLVVDVNAARVEVAERQIHQQEQQRVLGVFPNFRVTYLPNAAPLNSRQKFQLTWKTVADPTRFLSVAVVAGIQQARGDYSGFGNGPDGYAKRYAALYGTVLTGSLITNVVMPTVFKQDPRYFYKGTGSTSSRVGYAISRAVVRKGDNGHWQPDYSRILGHLAAGAISNFYYPAEDRNGVGLTLGNAGLGIGGAAVGNLMQEFVLRRFTTHTRKASE